MSVTEQRALAIATALESVKQNATRLNACLREFANDPSSCDEWLESYEMAVATTDGAIEALVDPRRHQPGYKNGTYQSCRWCGQDWPCAVARREGIAA